MGRMVRKNYLLPAEIASKLKRIVRSGRYGNESDIVRRSLQQVIESELKDAKQTLTELDNLARQTAKYLPKELTAGQLVHEAHVEE
jgi:Arc/MetJ-type ribon-helix-helix transcriptional regulator